MSMNSVFGGLGILILLPVLYYVNSVSNNMYWLKNQAMGRQLVRYRSWFLACGGGCVVGGLGVLIYAAGIEFVPLWIWGLPPIISYISVFYVIHRAVARAEWRERGPIAAVV